MLFRQNRIFNEISVLLRQLPDIEKMLSGLAYRSKSITPNTVRMGIDTLIFLKHSIKISGELSKYCQGLIEQESLASMSTEYEQETNFDQTQNYFLKEFTKNFSNDSLQFIESEISSLLSESTTFSKSAQEMRFQECFAIKSGVNGLLDVARKTYLLTIEEIHAVSELYVVCFIKPLTYQ